MVSSKLVCDYVPHTVATADWAVRFIDCSDAIGHEMANTTSGGRHRDVVLGEAGNLALFVLFTTAKKRLTGVPLWQGPFSSPSSLVPGCLLVTDIQSCIGEQNALQSSTMVNLWYGAWI